MKRRFVENCIIFTLVTFMSFSCYNFFISGFTYGDFFLLVTSVIILAYLFINHVTFNLTRLKYGLIFVSFVFLFSCVSVFITGSFNQLSFFRYLFYIISCLIISQFPLNLNRFFKVYQFASFLFAIYAILQFVLMKSFSFLLPPDPLKGIIGDSVVDDLSSGMRFYMDGSVDFRSYGLFIEPAYMAMFHMPILVFILSKTKKNLFDYLCVALIIVTMFCGRTLTGIILSLIILFVYIIKGSYKKKYGIVVLLLSVGLAILLIQTPYFDKIFKLFYNNGEAGNSLEGRIGNIPSIFNDTNSASFYFGYGLWYDTEFLPSIARILVSFGLIGYFIFIAIFTLIYKNSNSFGRKLTIILVISFLGTNSLFNLTIVIFMSLIMLNVVGKRNNEINDSVLMLNYN